MLNACQAVRIGYSYTLQVRCCVVVQYVEAPCLQAVCTPKHPESSFGLCTGYPTTRFHSLSTASRQQTSSDITQLSPELQSQWDHTQNAHLGSMTVTPGSGRRVHWICTQCPDGHRHRWQASVVNRTNGRGCPFCSGQALCPHNSLARKAPHLAKEWDTAKNPDSPGDYTFSSNQYAHWKCSQGHQWQALINNRSHTNYGCPMCAKSRSREKLPTLTASTSKIIHFWDWEQNTGAGLDPSKLTCGSGKVAHFTCDQCSLSQPHTWTAVIQSVVRGSGCPYCSSKRVCMCNSLLTLRPDLAAEWCYALNEGTPDEYIAKSHAEVWWENDARGTWKQKINDRFYSTQKPRWAMLRFSICCTSCLHVVRTRHLLATVLISKHIKVVEHLFGHTGNLCTADFAHLKLSCC